MLCPFFSPRSTLEVEAVRRDQFAEFAKAVQVGLLDFQGPQGVKAFFSLMRSRYGQVTNNLKCENNTWNFLTMWSQVLLYVLPKTKNTKS